MKAAHIFSAIAAAAVISAASVPAFAEDDGQGYVAFTAIKSTIGQGFTTEPVLVPISEGDTGIDIVKKAAEIQFTESDYGAYITAFADDDLMTEIPEEIAAVCPERTGRTTEGWLSSLDYTAESGWSYFINGEYAQVGISDYVPQNGDVLEFRFSVYGYGADLGIDNSSWGGAAALVEPVDASKLILACAEAAQLGETDSPYYTAAMEVLAEYGATQEDIDSMLGALTGGDLAPLPAQTDETTADTDSETAAADDKGSPDTGVEGLAVILGVSVLACGAIALSRKKK